MIGTGYVGLVSGTCFADLGNKVYCVDKDKTKIKKLKSAISPIYEHGLDDLIKNNFRAKRLYFTDNLEKAIKDSQKEMLIKSIPLGRMGSAAELASTVSFLASENASYITGENINVNGGLYM